MVEHPAVNRVVVGSTPISLANRAAVMTMPPNLLFDLKTYILVHRKERQNVT